MSIATQNRRAAGEVVAGAAAGGQFAPSNNSAPDGAALLTLNRAVSAGEARLAEVIPDPGQREAAIDAYIGAAIWSSEFDVDRDDDGLDQFGRFQDDYDTEDLADQTYDQMHQDLADFIADNTELVDEYIATGNGNGYGYEQLGHDFWLTRNGHGAGFWDRGLGELGTKLTTAAKSAGSLDLYVGDDGKVYAQ